MGCQELNKLPSHRIDHSYFKQDLSDHTYYASALEVAISDPEIQHNDIEYLDDNLFGDAEDCLQSGTNPPELRYSIDGPFTWQKQAITCADDENTGVDGDEPGAAYECKGAQKDQAITVDLETVVECEQEEREHGGYLCNECAGGIVGSRYACVQCADYDVCATCEARGKHAHHYALRVPSLKPRDEVQRIIEAIQKCINDEPSLIFLPVDDSVKIEVKNEDEDQPNQTDCESDPLMVPTVHSLFDGETFRQVPVVEPEPLRLSYTEYADHTEHVEHSDHTDEAELSNNIHDEHFNQQFTFNASSVSDTGQDYREVYYLISDDTKSGTLNEIVSIENILTRRMEVDDLNSLVDDINDPTNSVEESCR